MRSRYLVFAFLIIIGFGACNGGNKKFTVIGSITNMPQQTVKLEEVSALNVITVVDSTKSSPAGGFELSGNAPEAGLYRIRFGSDPRKFLLLSIDKGDLKVTGDWNKLEEYQVAGSPASASLRNFIAALRTQVSDFNSMSIVLDTLRARGNDSVLDAAKKDFMDMQLKFRMYVENYADTTVYLPNAVFAARVLNASSERNYLDAFTQSLSKRFPGARMAKDFETYYNKVAGATTLKKAAPGGIDVGMMAKDINLPTADGKMIALSSLKGKYVLLDFWASWCGPCRGENPNVVAAYHQFKDKNFTVYSVSLDSKKEAWQKAIADDNLSWPTHVSDLKGWESSAALEYGIESIPSNFLIDPTGKIIARDLRGDKLEETLTNVIR